MIEQLMIVWKSIDQYVNSAINFNAEKKHFYY